jgi:hypothetical protein
MKSENGDSSFVALNHLAMNKLIELDPERQVCGTAMPALALAR